MIEKGSDTMSLSYTWLQMLWIVLIYSVLGWCTEVAYAAVHRGRFVNRGFLNGPVCPIYGFGMLIVLLVLEPVKEDLALLFLGSALFCSALEFVVGWALEKLFHDKWWDYSDCPFNLKGYVCLEFSLIWGVACVLAVDVIHPLIFKAIQAIPARLELWLALALAAVLLVDMGLTLGALLKLPRHFRAIDEVEKALTAVSDTVGEKLIYDPVERGKERQEAFNEKHPQLAEKRQGALREMLDKRTEWNRSVKEKEDAGKAALREKREALLQKLRSLAERSFVLRRIQRAYPHLARGQHFGLLRKDEEERQEDKSA